MREGGKNGSAKEQQQTADQDETCADQEYHGVTHRSSLSFFRSVMQIA